KEHGVVWRHMDAVRARILPLAPRPQEIALSIEDDHRVLPPVEDVNVVAAIDANPANLLKGPAVGEFCPLGNDAVFELAGSDDHRKLLARAPIRAPSIATPLANRKLLRVRADIVRPMSCPYAVGRSGGELKQGRSGNALRRKRLAGVDPRSHIGARNPDLRPASSFLGFPVRAHPLSTLSSSRARRRCER